MVSCQKGPSLPSCLRMADRTLLAGYPRYAAPQIINNLTFCSKVVDAHNKEISHSHLLGRFGAELHSQWTSNLPSIFMSKRLLEKKAQWGSTLSMMSDRSWYGYHKFHESDISGEGGHLRSAPLSNTYQTNAHEGHGIYLSEKCQPL